MKGSLWWVLLASLLCAGLVTHRGLLVIFILILILASGASALWAKYCLSNVTYRRRLGNSHLPFGEETTLELEIVNAKPLPLAWLLVRDHFPRQITLLTGRLRKGFSHKPAQLVMLFSLRWYERVIRIHRIRGDERGVFQIGPAELISGDMFGARRRKKMVKKTTTLVVYPKVVPIHILGLPTNRPLGEWGAPRQIIEDPLRFAAVREYVPGDNPRYIHWKATARTGKLQSKVFEPSTKLTLLIAVDVQTRPKAYETIPEYLEFIISTAASLATYALEQRHSVGLYANSLGPQGEHWVQVPPSRHPQQAMELLTALASLTSFRGIPFTDMLHQQMPALPFGATIAAITARPNSSLYETLDELRSRGHGILLLTVGESPPQVPFAIPTYHLGGLDVWQRLEALELA